jgi:hypothetical protein
MEAEIQRFDTENSDDIERRWMRWKTKLGWYFTLKNMKSDELKRISLLFFGGDGIVDIYEENANDNDTYDQVINKIDAQLLTKANTESHIKHSNKVVQNDQEMDVAQRLEDNADKESKQVKIEPQSELEGEKVNMLKREQDFSNKSKDTKQEKENMDFNEMKQRKLSFICGDNCSHDGKNPAIKTECHGCDIWNGHFGTQCQAERKSAKTGSSGLKSTLEWEQDINDKLELISREVQERSKGLKNDGNSNDNEDGVWKFESVCKDARRSHMDIKDVPGKIYLYDDLYIFGETGDSPPIWESMERAN